MQLLNRLFDSLRPSPLLHVAYDNGAKNSKMPPLVFLHGIAASSKDFGMLKSKLPRGRRVVFLELLGYGDSPHVAPLEYTLATNVRAVFVTLRKLGISHCTVVGYSMGALLAVAYGGRYGTVDHVVCCSMPLYAYEPHGSAWHKVVERLYTALSKNEGFTLGLARIVTLIPNRHSGFSLTSSNWEAFYGDLQHIIVGYNPLKDAKRVPKLTMVVGKFDPFVSLQATRQFAAACRAVQVYETRSPLHTMTTDYDETILRALELKS